MSLKKVDFELFTQTHNHFILAWNLHIIKVKELIAINFESRKSHFLFDVVRIDEEGKFVDSVSIMSPILVYQMVQSNMIRSIIIRKEVFWS